MVNLRIFDTPATNVNVVVNELLITAYYRQLAGRKKLPLKITVASNYYAQFVELSCN